MNKLMTKEFFEETIERLKEEGELPEDFEIVETILYDNGVLKQALGYARRRDTQTTEEMGEQLYDVFQWFYNFGMMDGYKRDWSEKVDNQDNTVRWNKETNRPEYYTSIGPFEYETGLEVRPPRFEGIGE